MNDSKKLSNLLRQTWQNTNNENWDTVEPLLKKAKIMINNGELDPDLIDSYIVISEAFYSEFKERLNGLS